jgi:hypothetical protein
MTNTSASAPAITESGVVCGNCTTRVNGVRVEKRHSTSKDVARCYYLKFHAPKSVEMPTPVGMQVVIAAEVTEPKVITHEPKTFGRFSAKCYHKGCKTHKVSDHYFVLRCYGHGKVTKVKAKQLVGTYSSAEKHHCDDRCIYATGPVCVCSCGGAGHGTGYLVTV